MIAAWATPEQMATKTLDELEAEFVSVCQQFDSPAAEHAATHRDLMDTRAALGAEIRRRKGEAL